MMTVVMLGCDKMENEPEPEIKPDNELLELAYDVKYRYPVGFYHEKDLIGSRYYVNTVSIHPVNQRDKGWVELHTISKEEARTWSNLSNEYSSVNRILVNENITEKFFEFVRVNELRDTDVLLSRVHRSDYFIPHFDKSKNTLPIFFREHVKNVTFGVYKGSVTLDKVKELIEYLWDCYTLSIAGEKIVWSKIYEKADRFEYHIQSLQMVGGDWGIHDTIYVLNNIFSLDKGTKVLILAERKQVKEIEGKYR